MISAILLIVLLAGLGAVAVSVGSAQGAAAGLDIAGLRASQAAQAGIEWMSYRVLIPPAPAAAPPCPGGTTNLALPGSLAPFTVSVTCARSGPYTDGASTVYTYQITATACNQPVAGSCPDPALAPGAGYVERQVSARVQR